MTKAFIAAGLASAVFTGCGYGSVGGTIPTGQCTVALIAGSLISPAPNATGVATTVGTIRFSVSDAGMLGGSFVLVPSGAGANVQGTGITGTPSNASVTVPALQPHTTYQAILSANLLGDPCNPRAAQLGSFTTGS